MEKWLILVERIHENKQKNIYVFVPNEVTEDYM